MKFDQLRRRFEVSQLRFWDLKTPGNEFSQRVDSPSVLICHPTPHTSRDTTSQRWSEIRKSALILPKYHQNQWENVQTIRFELRKNLRFALWNFFHTFIFEIMILYFRNPPIICDDLAKKYLKDHNSPKKRFFVILVGVPTKNQSPKSSTTRIPLQFWMSPDRNREKI